jgi:hypothetical protein
MSYRINVQEIAGGQLPNQGKVYFGAFGDQEPENSPITIYLDPELTRPVDSAGGIDLGLDGEPWINGVKSNLYVAQKFSMQIRDMWNATHWPEPIQVPQADPTITHAGDDETYIDLDLEDKTITINAEEGTTVNRPFRTQTVDNADALATDVLNVEMGDNRYATLVDLGNKIGGAETYMEVDVVAKTGKIETPNGFQAFADPALDPAIEFNSANKVTLNNLPEVKNPPSTDKGIVNKGLLDERDAALQLEIDEIEQEIIDLEKASLLPVKNIANMKTLELEIGQEVEWFEYYEGSGKGGNTGVVVEGGTGTTDGGSYFDLDNGLQVKAIFNKSFDFFSFGAIAGGSDQTSKIQKAIDFASSSRAPIVNGAGFFGVTNLNWNDGVSLRGISSVESGFTQLSDPSTNILSSSSPVSEITIIDFEIGGIFALSITPGSDPNRVNIGVEAECEDINSYWHTWRRSDARETDTFNGLLPIFGDPDSYDGTGGLKVYHADAWYTQIYGNQGSSTIVKTVNSGDERKVSRSDYHINYTLDSVIAPPAQFNTTVLSATSFNASTVTLNIGNHTLVVDDYFWWDAAKYSNGGSDTHIETTYQITAITTDTITFTVTADPSFVSWIDLGRITDDPDDTGKEHVHDPSLGTIRRSWIRNGTSGIDLGCRVPLSRLSGFCTARVKVRHISGHNGWFVRLFQNFGKNGSPNTSTTFPGLTLQTGSSAIQEFIIYGRLPDIDSKTFEAGSFMQLTFVPSIFYPDAELDLFEISVFEGLNAPSQSNSSYDKEISIFEKLYRVDRSQILAPVEAGRFYASNNSFSEPMYGTPTVTLLNEISSSDMEFSSISAKSVYGYGAVARATDSANVGQYIATFETEYQIPTGYVGG